MLCLGEFVFSCWGGDLGCEELRELLLCFVEDIDCEGFVALDFLCYGGFVVQADQEGGGRFGGDGGEG